jgi:hypothetical protein
MNNIVTKEDLAMIAKDVEGLFDRHRVLFQKRPTSVRQDLALGAIGLCGLQYLHAYLEGTFVLNDALQLKNDEFSRWIQGQEKPDGHHFRAIMALQYVIVRLSAFYRKDVVVKFLYDPHPLLGGGRPVDNLHNLQVLIEAIDQQAAKESGEGF